MSDWDRLADLKPARLLLGDAVTASRGTLLPREARGTRSASALVICAAPWSRIGFVRRTYFATLAAIMTAVAVIVIVFLVLLAVSDQPFGI